MNILFSKAGNQMQLVDKEKLVFCIDNQFYDANGRSVIYEKPLPTNDDDDDDHRWYQYWMEYEGLEEPLKSESTVEVKWEIDDVFGNFGFKNEAGEFVIEPQYAYAHEFTNGLASVNLNRTWYKTEDGKRYYENHFGYIDSKGKTVIGFQFDEAYPFNKYGVAVVYDLTSGWYLIDKSGNVIPGAKFPYLSHYYEYENRFLEFSYDTAHDALVGIYDTKERKILLEPSIDSIIEWSEDCILVYERNGSYGISDFHQHFRNSQGEILYPWLYGKGFAIVERPDRYGVSAVAISEYEELDSQARSYFPHNGKKYERKFIYGLYSSKEKFLLPMKYDKITRLADNVWGCYKDGIFTVVQTNNED